MKGKQISKFFEDVPPWAKGVFVVSILAGIGVTIWWIHDKRKKEKMLASAKEENKTASDAAKSLIKQGIKPTMTGVQLQNAVNGIKTAFLDYDLLLRTHFQPFVREMVKVNNDVDMLNLMDAYGIQTIDFPATQFATNDFTGNLTQSAKHFLNNDEIKAVNSVLARKGIKYRF